MSAVAADAFAGRSVLVTGGSRGIGRAIVHAFAAAGATVRFTATRRETAEAALPTGEAAARVRYEVVDASDAAGATRVVEALAAETGRIDVLINNAGITRDGLVVRMSDEDWARVLAVNLTGTFNYTRAAARFMMKAHYGRIVNVSSVVGRTGNAGQANYAASKGGMIAFTRSVARELGGRGITANVVAPGYIDTDMTAALPEQAKRDLLATVPLGRMGTPDDVAGAVLFLAGPAAGYVTGQVLVVDGGMT